MNIDTCYRIITDETLALLHEVDNDSVTHLVQAFDDAKRIFCGASGRSGYILRCFCMRLTHLGYQAYFAGDTATPPIDEDDIFVALSGSGETPGTRAMVDRAKEAGARVFCIIGTGGSPMGTSADHLICLPSSSKRKPQGERFRSEQPAGSLFEQAAFVLLESMVLACYEKQGSNAQALLGRHANLE